MLSKNDVFLKNESPKRLIVMIHGYSRGPKNLMEINDTIIQKKFGQSDVFIPALSINRTFGTELATDIVEKIAEKIDWIWKDRQNDIGKYTEVILLGHSFGGILTRALFLRAWGHKIELGQTNSKEESPEQNASFEWAPHINRIVLLAAMNGGWTLQSAMKLQDRLLWSLGSFVGHVFLQGKTTIFSLRKGAPFLTELRLAWLDFFDHNKDNPEKNPVVVQLLGTIDDLVDPNDNIDLYTGRDFYYLEVPNSGHGNILRLTSRFHNLRQKTIRRKRRFMICLALKGAPEVLEKRRIPISWLGETTPLEVDQRVKDVVFVIHGIRDFGFWTQKLGFKLRKFSDKPEEIKTVTPTYGYFPILPFLLPWTRLAKVEWLMDQYVRVRMRYPNAKSSFVGHSNGTYLLTKALTDYPSAKFKNVAFAGSVVRRNFDWKSLIEKKKIEKVLNFVATSDWVVAIFPKGLQIMNFFDLGSAGHDGFQDQDAVNSKYVAGTHFAGVKESLWDEIAHFIIEGKAPSISGNLDYRKRRNWLIVGLGYISTFILLSLLAVALVVGIWLVMTSLASLTLLQFGSLSLLIIFLLILRFILTQL